MDETNCSRKDASAAKKVSIVFEINSFNIFYTYQALYVILLFLSFCPFRSLFLWYPIPFS